MKFNDFKVANKLDEIINYNLDNKLTKIQNAKHFRGTILSVDKNVASVYILNASTPVTEVKISSGLTNLMPGDDVYLMAINGSINNLVIDTMVLDAELLFGLGALDNRYYIETFQNYYEWVHTNGILDQDNLRGKYNGISVKSICENTALTYTIQKTLDSTLDLAVYENGGTSTDDDYIFISFYISDLSAVNTTNGIKLYFEKDGSNNYYYSFTGALLTIGWNNLSIKKSSFAQTGTMAWTDVNYYKLQWTSIAGHVNEYVSFSLLAMAKTTYLTSPNSDLIEIGSTGSIYAQTETYNNIKMSQNRYDSGGTDHYIEAGYATLYEQKNGKHSFYTAPSGSANAAISFIENFYIDTDGKLVINTHKITIQSSTPVSPSTNDLWIDIS